MKTFMVDPDELLTVAAGVLDKNGVLVEANAGFLRLLPGDCDRPIGANVALAFIQPPFSDLVAPPDGAGSESYRGLMTIGDRAGLARTLRGRVWRIAEGLRVLAEYDIVELERLGEAILALNQESAVAQNALARANLALKQRESSNVQAALTDPLTGTGNRRSLDQALAAEISRIATLGGTLSAIMIDVDHFKSVNDEYGHAAGDKVLVRIGALLKSQTRPGDIVARFGGEEFIVLLPQTHLAQAISKAEALRGAIAAEVIVPLTKAVTSSFGVAELSPDETGESLFARVDAALYQAKEGGRNKVATAITP